MVTFKVPKLSDIEVPEFLKAIEYIKENKLIQDSENLLSNKKPMIDSVSYPLILPNQKRELFFKVGWAENPDKYIGCLQSSNDSGDKITQARMYCIQLKE